MPIKYSLDNFLLFHSCIENISNNNNKNKNIINNSAHYLKNLYNYLENLQKKKYVKIKNCLLIFLKCCYKLAINIKTADYEMLKEKVTPERVKEHFKGMVKGEVVRYELPNICALNFVMQAALGGGVTRSLSVDMHGKGFSSYLLDMEI
jgi:predicted RND superfamily exporter protein